MVRLSKKNLSFAGFFALILCLHTGCTKEQIAPANQSVAFVKYYGHVGEQKGSDLKRTIDGGYIMIGSTNSYSSESESDMFVVKTDSLGNEEWSTALGKAAGAYVGTETNLVGKYVRYHEEGIRIVELPDASGYVVVGNRTYVSYISGTSTTPFNPEYKTKVVLYQLDPAGVATSLDGLEFRMNTTFTEKVSDLKMDTMNGGLKYVFTGYTNNVVISKPRSGIHDKTDIYTVVLDEAFTELWSFGVQAYGFEGEDYGASVHVMSDAYLITGTVQIQETTADPFMDRLFAVKMSKINAAPLNTHTSGDNTYDMLGGASAYDAVNHRITISGCVNEAVNYKDHAVLYQLTESLVPAGTGGTFGFEFYRPTAPTTFPPAASTHRYYPKSIALLPENTGFVLSMTHEKSTTEHNVVVMKVDQDLKLDDSSISYFGYEDPVGAPNPTEGAGAIITVIENIAGTSQSTLKGYAFTGTFDIGTNDMIGLIKIKDDGTFNP